MSISPRHSSRRISPRAWVVIAIAVIVAGAGIAALAVFPPNETPWFPACSFREVTGYHCPGCGTTRSLHALLNGHLSQAIAYNPFTVAAVAWLVWEMVAQGLSQCFGYRKPKPATWAIWTFVGLLILFGILRNIPGEPFASLAPHEIP